MSFKFEVIKKGEVKITKYVGKDEYLIIPSFTFINNYVYRVIEIDRYALNNSYVKKMFIPRTIKYIHPCAFLGFNDLAIDEFLVDSKNKYYCSINGHLFTKDEETLLKYAPMSKAETYKMPNSIKHINASCFEKSIYLKNIKFSSNLISIGDYAFSYCSNLEKIDFPLSLKTIGDFVFYNHENIKKIKLSSNLEYIGEGAFFSIRNPNFEISISKDNKAFKIYKGGLYSYNKEVLYKYMNSYEEIYLSTHLKEIKPYAFSYLFIDKVDIPDSVEIIGNNAFIGSTITSINISNNVKTIKRSTFEYCKFLKDVKLPENLISIEDNAFSSCPTLKTISLPKTIKYLGESSLPYIKVKSVNEDVEKFSN